MQARLTSREFTESLAYERLEPDSGEETVRLLGLLVTLMHNVYRDRDRKPEPFDFDDFVPDPYGIPKAQRLAEFRRIDAQMREMAKKRRAERVH